MSNETKIKGQFGRSLQMRPHQADNTYVYIAVSGTGIGEFMNINVTTEELVSAINKIPGVTATYEKPVPPPPPLPTEPGIYVARDVRDYVARVVKRKPEGWADAEGYDLDVDEVKRIAGAGGLVRLVPDE